VSHNDLSSLANAQKRASAPTPQRRQFHSIVKTIIEDFEVTLLEKKFLEENTELQAGPRLSVQNPTVFAKGGATPPAPMSTFLPLPDTAPLAEPEEESQPGELVKKRPPKQVVTIWNELGSVVFEEVEGKKVVKAGNLDQLIIHLTRPEVNLDGKASTDTSVLKKPSR